MQGACGNGARGRRGLRAKVLTGDGAHGRWCSRAKVRTGEGPAGTEARARGNSTAKRLADGKARRCGLTGKKSDGRRSSQMGTHRRRGSPAKKLADAEDSEDLSFRRLEVGIGNDVHTSARQLPSHHSERFISTATAHIRQERASTSRPDECPKRLLPLVRGLGLEKTRPGVARWPLGALPFHRSRPCPGKTIPSALT